MHEVGVVQQPWWKSESPCAEFIKTQSKTHQASDGQTQQRH